MAGGLDERGTARGARQARGVDAGARELLTNDFETASAERSHGIGRQRLRRGQLRGERIQRRWHRAIGPAPPVLDLGARERVALARLIQPREELSPLEGLD